jgi:3-oxoacyl-[acyl-carrier protein] reductase
MDKPLAGKIALVTGAGKNIGRGIAMTLARDGAAVIVNGRDNREAVDAVVGEIEAAGGKAMGHIADVSDPPAVAQMMEAAVGTMGGLDILVSNAGLRRQTGFLDMSFEEWREILSVALDGAFLLSQAAVPHMIKRGGGAIVAMSGISTHVGTPRRCHVSASKSGLEGLIRALAIELAPHRITCNCVSPGAIDTQRQEAHGLLPNRMRDDTIPLGRKGTVDEIAAMVRLLAGPEGAYVTGQTIHVNGGVFLT